jgi:hypothetical protein
MPAFFNSLVDSSRRAKIVKVSVLRHGLLLGFAHATSVLRQIPIRVGTAANGVLCKFGSTCGSLFLRDGVSA